MFVLLELLLSCECFFSAHLILFFSLLLSLQICCVCAPAQRRYTDALSLYSRVKNRLGERDSIASFDEHQAYTRRVQSVLAGMLLPVDPATRTLRLSGVLPPTVPPEWMPSEEDVIPVRRWFGLQSAARWAASGVLYPQLGFRIYPRPGCYFAVRSASEHALVFSYSHRAVVG